jgi:hypothetical protein
MATSLKTVQFAYNALAALANNTLTTLTQITVYMPDLIAKANIKAAWLEVSMDDIATTAPGNVTARTVNLRLNAVAYNSTTNANTLTGSGENLSLFITRDFTNYFVTNWAGTSMTCDVQVLVNATSTTNGMVNVCTTLHITYEYDDTSTTQIKTVYIPLNAPVTTLPTVKTSHDTIPILNTYLPESTKVFRSMHIITQANTNPGTATDFIVTYQLDSLTAVPTGNYESSSNQTDRWVRYVWNVTATLVTSGTHTFNVYSSVANRYHSMHAWLVVTYEFNATNTTSVMNSLLLPMELNSPIGISATDFQRASRELMVQETNPILVRLAAFVRWNNVTNETGLNARVGTGAFIAYTNTGSGVIAGGKGMMIRNDAPTGLTFGRGKNYLQLDIYSNTTTAKGGNFGALWMVNYTSDKASGGVGSHNHSIIWPLNYHGTGAATLNIITAATTPGIPETNYYISALGLRLGFINNGTNIVSVPSVNIERLVAEGGLTWENGYSDAGILDTEVGYNESWSQIRTMFNRWPGDPDSERMNIESGRRYGLYLPNQSAVVTASFWETFQLYATYHTISYTVTGTISGSAGGTVTINLYRTGTKDNIYSTTRSGNGVYTITWYDDVVPVYAEAYEDATHRGRSIEGTAGVDTFDISLSNPVARAFA